MELRKKWEGTAEEKKGRAVQTVILPKSKSSVRVSLNSFMRPEREHREESVSHFRGNTGNRACSEQGEGGRKERGGEGEHCGGYSPPLVLKQQREERSEGEKEEENHK